jgi:dihydrofolate reductase
MGRTQYYTATSLDGFIAGPDHSLEWLLQFGESGADDFPGFLADVGAVAMGASTYEWLLAHLGAADGAEATAWPYRQPAWVFTTRELPRYEGADVRFVRGDVAPVHAEMRAVAGDRNIWIVGGGDLAGQFHDRGLLDELIVTIASVTLGAGKPLLPRAIVSPPLHLVSVQTMGPSFVQVRYEVKRS